RRWLMNRIKASRIRIWILFGVGALALAVVGIWQLQMRRTATRPDELESLQEFELDKAKQKYIWDTEHIAFELELHFCKTFAAAVKQKDERRLLSLMRDGFEGYVLDPFKGTTLRAGIVTERRRDREGAAVRTLRAREFTQTMLASMTDFAGI